MCTSWCWLWLPLAKNQDEGLSDALASQELIMPGQLSWRRCKNIPNTLLVHGVPSEGMMFNEKKEKVICWGI